jgi:hypothetical protein
MESGQARLIIEVSEDGADPDAVVALTDALQQDLLELDVEDVDAPATAKPPDDAKAGEGLAIGTLVVTLTPAMLTAVVAVTRSWLSRQAHRRVKLKLGDDVLEMSGVSQDDQHRIVDDWLRRHADR